ncbi:MAG TPA: dienelactone hydrolase family protein [Thermoanaerobaculia bacterium]|nr:dienelactone hydrolase family protein [Thermoanaerobaculia bacterium]
MNWWAQPLLYPKNSGASSVRENVAVGDVLADVYLPAATPAPIVFLIHGGPIPAGAQMKNIALFRDYGQLLAGEGFMAVTFNHRYHAPNDFAQSEADVSAVIDHFRGDSNDVVLWAFSGGGPLLALGFDKPYVRALVDFYAVLEGEPIARVSEVRVPMLIARAGRDMPEVNEPLSRFLDAALAHGVELDLLNHAEGEHAFDIVTDDARTRQIIGRTLAFLRELRGR